METKNIYQKLLVFQGKVEAIKKDAQNPHFKNKYASLEQILQEVKPLLNELGLLLLQPVVDGKVITKLIDTSVTDSFVSSEIILPTSVTPQQLGSAITYFRRYSLSALLSLELADDDGAEAEKGNVLKKYIKGTKDLTADWQNVVQALKTGYAIEAVKKRFNLTPEQEKELKEEADKI